MAGCILYERDCIECGECNVCDLDPSKTCDNCCKCIETADYKEIVVDAVLSQDEQTTFEDELDDETKD